MRINFWRKETSSDVSYVPSFQEVDVVSPENEVIATEAVSASRELSGKAKIYLNVTRWIVYGGSFLVPLFFLPWTTSILEFNKQFLLVVVAGAGLITWLLGIVVSGQITLRPNAIDKGIGALLVGSLAATIFSISPLKSLFGINVSSSESFLTVLALSIFYFLAVNVFDDRGRALRLIISASFLVALAFGLAQMLAFYIMNVPFTHSRVFNTVGSVNALGLLAAIALPLFSKLRLVFRWVPQVDFAKLGLILAVVILAILNWWVLWTVAIVGMLVMIGLDSVGMAHAGERGFQAVKFLLPMTVIVLGVFLLIIKFTVTPVKGNLPLEIAPSFKLSGHIAGVVLKENLLFGYGLENFSFAFDKYGASQLANTTLSNLKFYDSISQLFNWVIDGGVVMILALVVFFWAIGEAFWKTQTMTESGALTHDEFSATVATVAVLVVSLLLYPFNTTLLFALYAGLALLVLTVWGSKKRVLDIEENPLVSLFASIGFIVGLIAVLAGSYFTAARYLADAAFAQALTTSDTNISLPLIVKAINWNNQDDRFYRSASQATVVEMGNELGQRGPDPQRATRVQNLITSAINLARRATEIEPRESTNWNKLGSVYQSLIGLVDNVEQLAEDAYLKAAELRPGDATFANQIGTMYLGRADLMRQFARSAGQNAARFVQEADKSLLKAEKYFKQAIDLAPNYGLAIYNLGAVYDREGKVSDAIKQLERIIPFNANQPNLLFELGLLYYRAGRKDDAAAAFQRAIILAPGFANARWYLALILEERKDLTGAIAQLEKIAETNKDNPVVIDKLDQLRKGQVKIPPQRVIDQKPL